MTTRVNTKQRLTFTNRPGLAGAAFMVRIDFTYNVGYHHFPNPLIRHGSQCNFAPGEEIEMAQM